MDTSTGPFIRKYYGITLTFLVASIISPWAPMAHCQEQEPESLPSQVRRIFKEHCHRCHNGPGSSSGYGFDVLQHDSLLAKTEEKLVVPYSLKESPLWDAIQKRMPVPLSAERHDFGDAQRAVIKRWIEAGAPVYSSVSVRPFVPLHHMILAIRDDLSRKEMTKPEQLNTRYFSLVHIHNNNQFDEEDIRYQRAALSKVLNSLSWMETIVVPRSVPVGKVQGILYAVDIRTLGWNLNLERPWKNVEILYPYGLKYRDINPEMAAADEQIDALSGSHQAWVRSDWFVVTATLPGLYHTLLDLPKSASALEQRLEVNANDNISNGKVVRAGFPKSGVSGQNRLVERHVTKQGSYWKSYDFRQDNARANIARFPLGPLYRGHPFPELAFRHDGGELIFNLPNGLQAYLLVDANDNRIDTGPVDVVSDDKKVSGTPLIVNGVSCMACHRHGMIPVEDTLRESNALFGTARETVTLLHPSKKAIEKHVEEDKARFLKSLEATMGTLIRAPAKQKTPVTEFREPVTEVVTRYRRHLDIYDVVSELYLENLESLNNEIGKEKRRELTFESLIERKGVLPRYQWDATDSGGSLMQKAAASYFYIPVVR